MASVLCARAAYCLHAEMTGLSGLNVGKFRGSRVSLNDGVGAVRAWGVLPAHQDDEVARFEQNRDRRHSCGQVVAVRRGLCSLLHGALVLVATVATAAMATAMREVAL